MMLRNISEESGNVFRARVGRYYYGPKSAVHYGTDGNRPSDPDLRRKREPVVRQRTVLCLGPMP